MSKVNVWFIVAKLDDSKYGCTQVSNKSDVFSSFDEADFERIYLQPDYDERLVVLKRTCQILD